LGGTVPQALAALANDVRALEGASQRQVVIPPRTTSYGVVNVLSETLGTDVLVTVGGTQYKGIISPGTVPTEVPQLDPSALVTFPAYLGKARLNGGAYVWVGIILKPSGVNIFDLLAPLPSNQKFQSRMTVQMPITGGGGATATVYLPWTV
jgi:hypothetical protein